MVDALTEAIGAPLFDGSSLVIDAGLIVSYRKGKAIDFLCLHPLEDKLLPIHCMIELKVPSIPKTIGLSLSGQKNLGLTWRDRG